MSLPISWVLVVALLAVAHADAHDCGDSPFSIARAESTAVAVSDGGGPAQASASSFAQADGDSSRCPPTHQPHEPSFPTDTPTDFPTDAPTDGPSFPEETGVDTSSGPDTTSFQPDATDFPRPGPDSGSGSTGSSSPDFDPGFSEGGDVSEQLREHIENANIEGVARTLDRSNNIDELAEGFRFDEDERDEALEKTDSRVNDGDVVSIKGIAKSAFRTGDTEKLARVMVKSVKPEDGDYPVDKEALIKELKEVLSDRKLLARIIAADPKKELNRRLAARRMQRKLTCNKCTPVNSYVCAHCWPGKVCKKFWWC